MSNRTADTLETFKMTDTVWKDPDAFTDEDRATIKNVFTVSNMLGHTFSDLIAAAQGAAFDGADEAAITLAVCGEKAMTTTQERHANQVAKRMATLSENRAKTSIVMPTIQKRARATAEEDGDDGEAAKPAKRQRKAS